MKTILICGDRNWTDEKKMRQKFRAIELMEKVLIIHGGARGADSMAGKIAESLKIPVAVYRAQWDKFGKAAGPIRNQRMLKDGKPDLVLAFHSNLEKSKGTKHMVSIAQKAGVPVKVIE